MDGGREAGNSFRMAAERIGKRAAARAGEADQTGNLEVDLHDLATSGLSSRMQFCELMSQSN